MKTYKLDKINITRYYIYSLVSLIVSVIIILLIIILIMFLVPTFKYSQFIFIFLVVIFGNIMYKFTYKKSIKEILVEIGKEEIKIEDRTILIESIKNIKITRRWLYFYPKISIYLKDNFKIAFNVSKNSKDYDELLQHIERDNNFKKKLSS